MNRKVLFILKLFVGAYLIFVGITLLRTVLDVRPGNQEMMCGVATVFIVVGAGYLIGVLVNTIKRNMNAGAAEYPEERNPVYKGKPVRDQSLFRTAPMNLADPDQTMNREAEGNLQEKRQGTPVPRVSSSTVTLQKVGPDTMVWENENKEK